MSILINKSKTSFFSLSLNGGLVEYFTTHKSKGSVAGDPLSPYLFDLIINVLSRLLDAAAVAGFFDYHPRCKRIKLSSLCFADDLLIFTKGILDSVAGIKVVLEGLAGKKLLQSGKLMGLRLVRYQLGTSLTEKNCAPLVDKITARISSWATRHLSYAARLQLVSKGKEGSPKRARVSWQAICYLKSEGKLEVKDILIWNLACVLQKIWSIIAKAGSLWITWIEAYELKGRSVWQAAAKQTSSWNWRKLLQIRQIASNEGHDVVMVTMFIPCVYTKEGKEPKDIQAKGNDSSKNGGQSQRNYKI
ncbi:uncharacterized protein LOC111293244 [Durio zibethinus]|uniref:Uncharacterized protein LOC111293244 n=1 Tax=Durio zibethinus TaxID=66656 RepID=A0A6P5YNA0_DURZI|nr:uncharacterized protein LOC111293244 [Durio zibethinus]